MVPSAGASALDMPPSVPRTYDASFLGELVDEPERFHHSVPKLDVAK
jgi:hypothetical protein